MWTIDVATDPLGLISFTIRRTLLYIYRVFIYLSIAAIHFLLIVLIVLFCYDTLARARAQALLLLIRSAKTPCAEMVSGATTNSVLNARIPI